MRTFVFRVVCAQTLTPQIFSGSDFKALISEKKKSLDLFLEIITLSNDENRNYIKVKYVECII